MAEVEQQVEEEEDSEDDAAQNGFDMEDDDQDGEMGAASRQRTPIRDILGGSPKDQKGRYSNRKSEEESIVVGNATSKLDLASPSLRQEPLLPRLGCMLRIHWLLIKDRNRSIDVDLHSVRRLAAGAAAAICTCTVYSSQIDPALLYTDPNSAE